MEKQYQNELNKIRLSDDSKRRLVMSLSKNTKPAFSRRVFRIPVIVAAIFLVTAVTALALSRSVLQDYYDSPVYEKAAAALDQSVTENGWTMTLTDCVGDDRFLYLGFELTAPEGTVFDEGYYSFQYVNEYFPGMSEDTAGASSVMQIDDDSLPGNQMRFILWIETIQHGEKAGSINGQTINLSFGPLFSRAFVSEGSYEETMHCDAVWDFGEFTISYPGDAIRLEPNIDLTVLRSDAAYDDSSSTSSDLVLFSQDYLGTLTSLEITPIGVSLIFEGDGLRGHHSTANNGECIGTPEIKLYNADGELLEPDASAAPFGVLGGSGCSGGTDIAEPGRININQTYGYLLDLDSLDYIEICGERIDLRN